ncbi:hypothetical protein [Tautonia sociabilis]|uniref:Uncharacterized protein n=1 Tax=Tautonia sociabilis TaxID=2080755 RepID=A0A432MMX8_9BACT|nr:hypothetical protein [Tautonia sociabilis]RUL88418.1 hypothetical protein TsocGM_06800 [Tautonia sociabilis]
MSSPIASPRDRRPRRAPRPAVSSSLREICLIGGVGRAPVPQASPEGLIRRSGRTYRVCPSPGPEGTETRRYLHLLAVPPDAEQG